MFTSSMLHIVVRQRPHTRLDRLCSITAYMGADYASAPTPLLLEWRAAQDATWACWLNELYTHSVHASQFVKEQTQLDNEVEPVLGRSCRLCFRHRVRGSHRRTWTVTSLMTGITWRRQLRVAVCQMELRQQPVKRMRLTRQVTSWMCRNTW